MKKRKKSVPPPAEFAPWLAKPPKREPTAGELSEATGATAWGGDLKVVQELMRHAWFSDAQIDRLIHLFQTGHASAPEYALSMRAIDWLRSYRQARDLAKRRR